ncbi:hypothetical protein DEO23_01680 [Brachybacterium endophyticum]|uniref:PucR family transcriptional regulator n=1 Tax=Brachybacterium endophyticum TaxID=2182385 RepID=A0A2U2RNC7_9MICO|nr:helix-turn-helix domain-containing protein [Brachybacterium endophyticum]PWH07379.1 hypothetical protein DEO23_01680 [Brachybacterium endophyticum]
MGTEETSRRLRVLVAGANGYLGRHLVTEFAARGHEVRCLVRRPEALSQPGRGGAPPLAGLELDVRTGAADGVDGAREPGEVRERLEEIVERFEVTVGLSDPAPLAEFRTAREQARIAGERGTGLVRFADVTAGSVLTALGAEGPVIARAALDPLIRHDVEHGTDLLGTLRTWLAQDAQLHQTAEALGIHRHTMRARIQQIERVLGRDLRSFEARAEVWAALRALG